MAETEVRFEPLSRRGVLLGLGAGQLGVAAVCIVAAFAFVSSWPGTEGIVAALACVALALVACRPVGGRAPTQWAAVAAAYLGRRHRRALAPPGHLHQQEQVSGVPGSPRYEVPVPRLPVKLLAPRLHLHELPRTVEGAAMGVLVDERSSTAAALLRARGAAFCLLDGPDKARRLGGWAGVLESLAGQGGPVARLQWCQRALPGDSEALLAYLRRAGSPGAPGYAGHAQLLQQAGPRSWRHETLLVLSVHCRSRRGRPSDEGVAALRNEVASLRAQMHSVGLVCEAVLDARATARALGEALVPGLPAGGLAHPGPLSFEEHWSEVRCDGLWHRTYWVAEWPRSRVGPDFLSPLLMGRGRRCFSVVMAPVPPEKAIKDAEASRTAQLADAHLRAQGGFLETAQRRREAEAVEGREEQLADGRGAFQMAGYVAVSAVDKGALGQACNELERSAAAARLCLRPLYGQQREALLWAMPFGRGL